MSWLYQPLSTAGTPTTPEFDQTGFRFYDDGSESASSPFDDENADPSVDVTSGNVNLGLRIRVAETAGGNGDSTDDYKLQYNLNAGGWSDLSTAIAGYNSAHLTEAAATTPRLSYPGIALYSDTFGDGTIDAIWSNWGGGNVTESSGTLNINSGTAASSYYGMDLVDTFDFDNKLVRIQVSEVGTQGAPYNLYPVQVSKDSNNTYYWIIVNNNSAQCWKAVGGTYSQVGSSITHVDGYYYQLRELDGTHYWEYSTDGVDWVIQAGEATAFTNTGCIFSLFTELTSLSTARTAKLDNFEMLDIDFISGKVSEDGTVDNLAITANNYTELLYSITVVATEVADADTIDFRVVRNGTVLDAYTDVATVSIIKTGGGATGQAKVYNGSSWVAKPIKVFNGSVWATKPLKVYDGSSWTETNY